MNLSSQEFHNKYYDKLYDKLVKICFIDGIERTGLFNDEFYDDNSILFDYKVVKIKDIATIDLAVQLSIDFSEPVIKEEYAVHINTNDLDEFYTTATEIDRLNLFFVLLNSIHYFELKNDKVRTAHMSFLAAYYLFVPLTPPASEDLALHYIKKAISLYPLAEYKELLEIIEKGCFKKN